MFVLFALHFSVSAKLNCFSAFVVLYLVSITPIFVKSKISRLYLVLLVKRNTHFIFIFSSDVYVLIINECDVLPMYRKKA